MATSWQEKRTKIKLIKRLKQDPIRHSVADTQYLELLRQCNFCGEQRLDHHCVDVVALYTNTDSGGAVEACVQLLRLSHEKIQISGWTKILWRCLEPWQKSTHPVSEMVLQARARPYNEKQVVSLLAIIFVVGLDLPALSSEALYFGRYIDVIIVVRKSPATLRQTFGHMNSMFPMIKLISA